MPTTSMLSNCSCTGVETGRTIIPPPLFALSILTGSGLVGAIVGKKT